MDDETGATQPRINHHQSSNKREIACYLSQSMAPTKAGIQKRLY